MKVKSITIKEFPPEIGPPGERLIIVLENDYCLDVSMDYMQSLDSLELSLMFERMAQQLRQIAKSGNPKD